MRASKVDETLSVKSSSWWNQSRTASSLCTAVCCTLADALTLPLMADERVTSVFPSADIVILDGTQVAVPEHMHAMLTCYWH